MIFIFLLALVFGQTINGCQPTFTLDSTTVFINDALSSIEYSPNGSSLAVG